MPTGPVKKFGQIERGSGKFLKKTGHDPLEVQVPIPSLLDRNERADLDPDLSEPGKLPVAGPTVECASDGHRQNGNPCPLGHGGGTSLERPHLVLTVSSAFREDPHHSSFLEETDGHIESISVLPSPFQGNQAENRKNPSDHPGLAQGASGHEKDRR